jgi:Cu/Ag efflux protein CusF
MLLPVLLLTVAAAQAVTQTPVESTLKATIEKIDHTNREITLKFEDDTTETLVAGPKVTRFDQLKVGDKVKFRYYESIAFQLRKEGSPAPGPAPKNEPVATPGTGALPGGTVARQKRETVTVMKVDTTHGSITVKEENGNIVSKRVKDAKNLAGIAPGDRIEMTYTEALLVSVEPET